MKLLANENFPLTSVNYLRVKGFNITAIGTNNPSISDEDVIDIAIRENRTILTFDRDYGELIFKHNYQPSAGVIYFRLLPAYPEEPGHMVEGIITSGKLKFDRALTVVDANGIRQRRY